MERRFKLGNGIVVSNETPGLEFSEDGKKLILTFSVHSEKVPGNEFFDPNHPQKETHRDIFELAGGSALSTGLKASLAVNDDHTSILTLNMKVNTKVPGTGAAFAAAHGESNGGHTG